MEVSVDQSKIDSLKPRNIKKFLITNGWQESSGTDLVSIYRKKIAARSISEIVVPKDKSIADYDQLLQFALQKINRATGIQLHSLANALAMPESDVLQFRIVDKDSEEGMVHLSAAPKYFSACEKMLYSSILSADNPKIHYSKMSKGILHAFQESCKVSTNTGSYVINIFCPHNVVEDSEVSDFARQKMLKHSTDSFTRIVTTQFMKSCAMLADYSEKGEINKFIDYLGEMKDLEEEHDPSKLSAHYFPSSNFIKNLLILEPKNENSFLEIFGSSSYGQPIVTEFSHPIKFTQDYFKDFEKVLKVFAPQNEPSALQFVGRVTSLYGDPTDSGKPAGDVEIETQYDEELIKAKTTLDVNQYAEAIKAHSNNTYIVLKGTLKMGVRSHRINSIEYFRLVDLSV